MIVFLLACCVSAWPQTPAASPSRLADERAQSLPPEPANPDFAAARTLLQQGKYDEAVAQLSDLAAKNPGLKGLSHELGTAYYKKGDYIKAIESFKQALAEDPRE